MELITIAGTAFIVALSGAMMPGPLLTVTITETARRGFIAGPLLILGHGILELALVLALVFGLAALLTLDIVSKTVALAGGAFLIWMGAGMIRDARLGRITLESPAKRAGMPGAEKAEHGHMHPVVAGENETGSGMASREAETVGRLEQTDHLGKTGRRHMHPVVAGVLVSLANPYWSLWWATIGLGYITFSFKYGPAGVASFFGGHIMADLAWYSLISAAVVGSGRILSASVYRTIIVFCGAFLVFLGGSFVYIGLK